MPSKTQPNEWSYNRRLALVRHVTDALYSLPDKRIPHRQFNEEAKKRLPGLFKEIEEANKKIDRLNLNNFPSKRELISKIRNEALFGTCDQCQKLADKYLL